MFFAQNDNLYDVIAGDVALTAIRTVIALASGWVVLTIARMLKRAPTHRQITVIPRSILWFTLLWNVVVVATSMVLLLFSSDAVTGAVRTIYGGSIAWALFGAAWIIAASTRGSLSALEAMRRISTMTDNEGGDA